MSGSWDMRARLVLGLRDGLSSGLDRIQGRLQRLREGINRIAGVAAIGAGLTVALPLQQAAAFEDALRQAQITAGLTGGVLEAAITRDRAAFERLARETGQRSATIVEAFSSLVATGMSRAAIDGVLPLIARTATATGATMDDLGKTVFQLQQQLRITADQMPQVLAGLAQAGRDGNFELRDMARELPSILAAARAIRMEGPGAASAIGAWLQVARTAAGTSSEAANNVLNALQKLASPETVRHFREIGVNIEAVMNDAIRQGINPMEAIVQKLRERTGGNLFRLQELFGDRQALMGLLPMIQETARYLDIRDRAAQATPALIDTSFEDRMRGVQMQMEIGAERVTQLSRLFALALRPAIVSANTVLGLLHDALLSLDGTYPGLIGETLSWVAAILTAVTAIAILGKGLGFLFGALRIAVAAFALTVGLGTGAILAQVALIAGAVYLIWRNWDRLGPWFGGLWEGIKGWFRDFVGWVAGWAPTAYRSAIDAITGVWRFLATWFDTLWSNLVAAPFNAFVAWVDSWSGGALSAVMRGAVAVIEQAWGALTGFFERLWSGIGAIVERATGPILAIINRIEQFFARNQAGSDPERQAQQRARFGARGGLAGFPDIADPDGAPGQVGNRDWRGRVVIEAAPGLVVREVDTSSPRVTIAPGNRGAAVALP